MTSSADLMCSACGKSVSRSVGVSPLVQVARKRGGWVKVRCGCGADVRVSFPGGG